MIEATANLRIHVDTSLQIEQQKVPIKALPVKALLSRYRFTSTSSYAKKEFKRAWLQDLNLIYAKARGCNQIGDVYSAIGKSLWHPKAKRRLERCLDAINAFLEPHPQMPIGIAVLRLRIHLAEAILGAFTKWERSVTYEYDGTECARARETPTRAPDGSIDCRVRACNPNRIHCAVHHFFADHKEEFKRITETIETLGPSASAELRSTVKTIRAASADPKFLCDSENCTAMSDAIIAVDGVDADHFGANNPKEWETLAKALGKPLINPVQR